jgi:molybdopterin-guanine dinucleotide biosynthesis protein A
VTLKEHKKHTAIVRPAYGDFGRNEYALVGAPCKEIKALAGQVIQALSQIYKCAYIDAQHTDSEDLLPPQISNGAYLEYNDQISYSQFNFKQHFNQFQYRQQFAEADLVLVNGNHHQAKAQVVIIDSRKKESLQKRVDQLDNVKLILLAEREDEPFDFIKEALTDWQQIPVLQLSDIEKVITFFKDQLKAVEPKLNGLVLAGGKSLRMGQDKATINWHGKEQKYYLADLLKNYCEDVFISCREDQHESNPDYRYLKDTFIDLGPFGAVLSAFRAQPEVAWLVVACDLPLLGSTTLDHLTANRKVAKIATGYISQHDNFPEPLITIWEPKSYPVLLSFLAQGCSCPRKVLINSDVNLLSAPDPQELTNVNTPEEFEQVKKIFKQKNVSV